jgi:uncharacterized protein (TIGR02145 family)
VERLFRIAGKRNSNGDFNNLGSKANFWLSSDNGPDNAWNRNLNSNNSSVNRNSYDHAFGFSIRCLSPDYQNGHIE